MLPIADLELSLAFYVGLGFAVVQRRDDWGWAEIRWGDHRVMLDRSIQPHPGAPRTGVLYLYPDDLDGFVDRARARGLVIADPEPTFYGMRECRVEDPDGNRLWIGSTG